MCKLTASQEIQQGSSDEEDCGSDVDATDSNGSSSEEELETEVITNRSEIPDIVDGARSKLYNSYSTWGLTISRNGTDQNGPKRPLFHGMERTVQCTHRAIQRNALTKYQVSNAFGQFPRPSNSSTILLMKELASSLPSVKPKVGEI